MPWGAAAWSLTADVDARLGVHEQGYDETVQTQDFGENENQNHSDEQTGLLSCASDTCVTDDTDGEAGSETSQADGQTSTELDEASVEGKLLLQAIGNEDGHDETIDTNDTSHNDGHNVCTGMSALLMNKVQLRVVWARTLDDEVRSEDTHSCNTHAGLGGSIRGT
jgi:hypothetical protein